MTGEVVEAYDFTPFRKIIDIGDGHWNDEYCRKILGNIAGVMDPSGKVLVIEMVMPERPEPHPAKFLNVNTLALTEGGSERTEREYADLFSSVGLKFSKILPTDGPASVVESLKSLGSKVGSGWGVLELGVNMIISFR